MIRNENDAKTRAILVIMNTMAASLQQNTASNENLAEKLEVATKRIDTHELDEVRLINQVRGAGRVIAWVIGVAQILVVAIWGYVAHSIGESHDTNIRQEAQIQQLMKQVEAKP